MFCLTSTDKDQVLAGALGPEVEVKQNQREVLWNNIPAPSHDHRIPVTCRSQSLFLQQVEQGEMTGSPNSIYWSQFTLHISWHMIYLHTSPLLMFFFLSKIFSSFLLIKILPTPTRRPPSWEELSLHALWLSVTAPTSFHFTFQSYYDYGLETPWGQGQGHIYLRVPGPVWHIVSTHSMKSSEQNWTGISRLPANVTAMETESYPRAFVALQV